VYFGGFWHFSPWPLSHSFCLAIIWLAGYRSWTKELLLLAYMSDKKKQDIRGLRSIYTVNMAGYETGPPDVIRIVLNLQNVVIFLQRGGLIYSTAVIWAASNV
jgi:hypothetical protein